MQENNSNKDKLVPLRKFSAPGIYSSAYLSQLVQKNKLKAVKIGRNYFTCQRWFSRYLERHAHDKKQSDYNQFLIKQEISKELAIKHRKFYLKTVVITAVFFVALILANIIFINHYKNSGQVAGVEEKGGTATSTIENSK